MTTKEPPTDRKFFTLEQANKMLPLVKRIIADITTTANELYERQQRLSKLAPKEGEPINEIYHEEFLQARDEQEAGVERLKELQEELEQLGILLKDYLSGLVDFPCWYDGREVYLCWKQGEPEVSWWHETSAGFAGRQSVENLLSL